MSILKSKTHKISKLLVVVCALALVLGVFSAGASAVLTGTYSVVYKDGDLPAGVTVTQKNDESTLKTFSEADAKLNKNILAAAPTCSDTNFEFLGWKESLTGMMFDAGDNFDEKSLNMAVDKGAKDTLEFTAVWGIKVTFDKNLSDTTETITVPEPAKVAYKEDYTVDQTLTATNYTFVGWATDARAVNAEAEYKVGDKITADKISGPITLYAVWKANFNTVTYHANTGSETTDSAVTVPVDSTKYTETNKTATIMGGGNLASTTANAATMTDSLMKRDGYAFLGWATSEEEAKAGTVKYKVGDTVEVTDDLNLYAVWQANNTTAANTTTGTTTNATTTTPQTGDNDHLYLYTLMAILSLLGIAYLAYDQKKEQA